MQLAVVIQHHICMALEKLQRWKCWCKERQWSHWDWHGSNMDDVVWDNIIHIPLQQLQSVTKTCQNSDMKFGYQERKGKHMYCSPTKLSSTSFRSLCSARLPCSLPDFDLEVHTRNGITCSRSYKLRMAKRGRQAATCNASTECCTGTRWGAADDKMWMCVNTSLLDCKM